MSHNSSYEAEQGIDEMNVMLMSICIRWVGGEQKMHTIYRIIYKKKLA